MALVKYPKKTNFPFLIVALPLHFSSFTSPPVKRREFPHLRCLKALISFDYSLFIIESKFYLLLEFYWFLGMNK